MAERTVNVRLNLDVSQFRRGSTESEVDARRLARTVEQSASQIQAAVNRAASSQEAAARRAQTAQERAAERSRLAVQRSTEEQAQANERAADRSARAQERSSSRQTAAQRAAARRAAVEAEAAAQAQATAATRAAIAQERAAARAAAANTSAFNRARVSATTWGASVRAQAALVSRNMASSAARSEAAWKGVRTASLGVVAAFALAVYASSKFESAMSGVKAATQAGAKELAKLRQAAIDAGNSTQYSATQAADAETELAKAGVSTADILGGALKGTLNLAAAGQMDVADSAVVAAKAMNSFGLKGSDMAHIADVIAAAAGKSATDVHGMSLAFAQSSLLAHQTGLSLEQTAGALALFAQNGLVGSDAGTSLKTMLMRLTPQSQEARDVMDKLGFSAYDAQGKFVGFPEVASRLQKSLSGLTPEARNAALGVIFGSDAIRAATIVSQAGAGGINTWTRAANDQGYAAKYAATQTDNLRGDLERLKSALETALIQSGSSANGVLRDMTKWITTVVRAYNDLPTGLKQTVTGLAGVTGAIGLAAAGFFLLIPKVAAFRTAMTELAVTMPRLAATAGATTSFLTGPWGIALAAGVTALTLFGAAHKKAQPDVEQLTEAVKADSGAIGDNTKAYVAHELETKGVLKSAKALGVNTKDLTDAILGNHEAMARVNSQLKPTRDAYEQLKSAQVDTSQGGYEWVGSLTTVNGALKDMTSQVDGSVASAKRQAEATGQATDGTKKLGTAALQTADDLQDTRTEAEKLTDALKTLNGINIDSAESAISFQSSLHDLRSAVKDNGHSLDITTEKGRAVKSAFLDAAKAAQAHAEAVAEQKNSVTAGNLVLAQDIEQLKKTMHAAGFTKEQIDALTAAYLKLPKSAATEVKAKGAAKTSSDLVDIRNKVNGVPAGKTVTVKAPTADAVKALKDLGFKVTNLPNHQIKITVPKGDAFDAAAEIQRQIDKLHGKTITVKVDQVGHATIAGGQGHTQLHSYGGVISRYAGGGTVPGYAPRLDIVPALLSPGEGVLVPEAVRALGGAKGIAALNVWGRYGRMNRFADGGVAGSFTYAPTGPATTLGVGTGMEHYDNAVNNLKNAWDRLNSALSTAASKTKVYKDAQAHEAQVRKDNARKVSQAEDNLDRVRRGKHTHAQLIAAEKRLSDARYAAAKADAAAEKKSKDAKAARDKANRDVTSARGAVNKADAALGLKAGSKAPAGFDLAGYAKGLAYAKKLNDQWEANLGSIGKRAGADVEQTLRDMGDDGKDLVAALAHATGKQFADIVKNLKALAPTAKATLADYTAQLNSATTSSKTFQANLLKLASMGYGDLATQLAAQGDDAAAAVAAAAVSSPSSAASANAAAKAGSGLLSGEDVANAVKVIAALKGRAGEDFAALVTDTGLDVSTLLALLPKIRPQIDSLPAANRQALLAQWSQLGLPAVLGSGPYATGARAPRMARGAILSGRDPVVIAGEARRRESYIPIDGSARSQALLGATAGLMGYQLMPAGRFTVPMGSAAGGAAHVDNSKTVVLNGAKQSSAEQAADILRHMTVLG